MTTPPLHPVEALLEQPSTQSHLVLETAIGKLLNTHPVKLADKVFTLKSTVIIDFSQSKDSHGNLLDGRDTRHADTFSLLTQDGHCYLRHNQNGEFYLLNNISCKVK
ncbi:hypothetical protein [uncultured Paraglaciecola sp.]|uniref:hypothetical protein n=1 Tax=uncultured Paraglaciecola sp. TaxID=1765024 RepID=UPI0030D8E3E3|tara:strand:- start:3525 stop:3845 length:321 start_codon:yes stop_codon:yes gene_type:complete